MSSKLFKNDKNYILKIAQKETKTKLISYLINEAIKKYELKSNPLGLIYKPYLKSEKLNVTELMKLNFFYRKISTIYRYNYGEVQLTMYSIKGSGSLFLKMKPQL